METNKRDFIVGCVSLALFAITGGYIGHQIGKKKADKGIFELGKLCGEADGLLKLYDMMHSSPKRNRNYYKES